MANRSDAARSLFAQGFASATGTVCDSTLLRQRLEIGIPDSYLRTHVGPLPISREVQTCECPSFDFFPGILSKEDGIGSELPFDLAQPNSTSVNAVTIDAKDEEVHHTPVLVDDFLDALRLQRFDNSAKQRVVADANPRLSKTDVFK